MRTDSASHPTYLFTLRLWLEELGDDRSEWRGQLQPVGSGEARYFRDWQTLVAFLVAMLSESDAGHQ